MTDFVASFRPSDNFSLMANHWFRDPRLSDKAKGRLGYLATHAPGYRLTIEQQVAETATGRDGIYTALAELVQLGYLVRHHERGADGKLGKHEYRWGPAIAEQQYVRAWGRPADVAETTPPPTASGNTGSGLPASGVSLWGNTRSGNTATKKNKLLEDQPLENQPPPPTPVEPPTLAPPNREEGEEMDLHHTTPKPRAKPHGGTTTHPVATSPGDAVLDAVLDATHVAPGRRPRGNRRSELTQRITTHLARGWEHHDAVDALSDPLGAVDSVYGTLRWRIDAQLAGDPPTRTRPAQNTPTAWCGQCESDDYRWTQEANGRWARCTRCNPTAAPNVPAMRVSS